MLLPCRPGHGHPFPQGSTASAALPLAIQSACEPSPLHVTEACLSFSRRIFRWLRLLCWLLRFSDWLIWLPIQAHMSAEMRKRQHVQSHR